MKFAETLKELRLRSGLSQSEVCKKLGISQQRLSTWETGRSMPTGDAFLRLVRLYNVENIMEAFGFVVNEEEMIKPTPYELSIIERLRYLDPNIYRSIVEIIDYAYDLKKDLEKFEQVESENITLIAAHGSEGMDEEELKKARSDAERLTKETKKND